MHVLSISSNLPATPHHVSITIQHLQFVPCQRSLVGFEWEDKGRLPDLGSAHGPLTTSHNWHYNCRQITRLTDSEQRLEAQITQLALDLQRSSRLLSRSEQDLQCKSDQLQQVQQQLSSCMALSSAAQQRLHSKTVQDSQANVLQQVTAQQQDQQQQSCVAAAAAAMASGESHVEAAAAAAALQEAEMLREKLHDSVELLEEADRQLKLKVAEVDEYRAGVRASEQELQQTRLQLQETQALLEEHAELLQQHNVQLLQAQEELQVSQSR